MGAPWDLSLAVDTSSPPWPGPGVGQELISGGTLWTLGWGTCQAGEADVSGEGSEQPLLLKRNRLQCRLTTTSGTAGQATQRGAEQPPSTP